MSETNYIYSISGDFPYQKVNTSRLASEIYESNITIVLKNINTMGDICNILFKDALDFNNKAILDAIVASHSGNDVIPEYTPVKVLGIQTNDTGIPLFQSEFPRGQEVMFISHNLCDKCSWYQESIRVENEILSETDGYNWQTTHTYLIDIDGGRIFSDFKVAELEVHNYKIDVWVNDVLQTERIHFQNTGGDYQVFYEDGYIQSFTNWSGSTVKCSYSYATGSTYTIAPPEGYEYSLEDSDVQFSSCLEYNDTICVEVWGYDPENLPNKKMYQVSKYKNVKEILEEARASNVGVVPALSQNTPRGTATSTIEIPFAYKRARILESSKGIEMRIRLENDIAFGGRLASVSLYGSKKLE